MSDDLRHRIGKRDRQSSAPRGAWQAVRAGSSRSLALVSLLCVTLLPWFLAADGPAPQRQQQQRDAHRQQIDAMTVPERTRFEDHLRQYRELPAAERDRLRALQQEIERDPQLRAAFDEYRDWANSLSPVDRHELRQAQSPEARRQLVETFLRRPPLDDRPEPFPSERPPNGPPFGQNNLRFRMLERLFDGVIVPFGDRFGSCVPEMEAIVRVLERDLSPEQRAELDKLDEFTRRVRVVRLTLERRPLGLPASRLFGPDAEKLDKLFAELPEGPVRQTISNRNFGPGPNSLDPRGAMLLMVVTRGLMTETQRTIEDHRPRPEVMIEFQNQLSESEQTRLNRLSREDRLLELAVLFAKDKVPGIGELQQMLGTQDMQRFFRQMANSRPGPPPEGDDRRDKKGRLPPFDGGRRPREDFPMPPNRPEPKD